MINRFNSLRTNYETHKQCFINGTHNEIYNLLTPISKCKYQKNKYCAQFQEDFFVDFIRNGHTWTNEPTYHCILHDMLVINRRQIKRNFLQFLYEPKSYDLHK